MLTLLCLCKIKYVWPLHRFLLLLCAVGESHVQRCILHQSGHVYQVTRPVIYDLPPICLSIISELANSVIHLFSVTGYRMAFSYFVGGKCITQNRNSMVSRAEICSQGPSFCNEAACNYPDKPQNFFWKIKLCCKWSSLSIFIYCIAVEYLQSLQSMD